jgi:hypothetical protein
MLRRNAWAGGALVALLAATPALAQGNPGGQGAPPLSVPKEDPRVKDWKPALFPADALAYGAALEAAAPPKLKAWCENFARKEMPKRRIDPRESMAVVDKQFAKNSDAGRDAAIYLLDYLSYKHEDSEQQMLAQRIRQIDDKAYDVTRRMIVLKENQERGMSTTSKNQAAAAPDMFHTEEEMRKMEQQLREMAEDRKLKVAQLEMWRKRVDGYLKIMSVTYPRMNGVTPEVLKEFQ